MIQPGTALWFARHEARLAWRDWIAMMTAGRRERLWKVAIGFAVFVILMHTVAYSVVGRLPARPRTSRCWWRSPRACCCRGC
jgi:ABC-2 type transport system permease protein